MYGNQLFRTSSAIFLPLILIMFASSATALPIDDAFEAAEHGDLEKVLQLILNGRLTKNQFMSARDKEGNPLLSAVIQGFPAASKENGPKAANLLLDICQRIVKTLNKHQNLEMLNAENSQGKSSLFIAAQYPIPKLLTLLYKHGARVVNKKGIRASSLTTDAHNAEVLRKWEALELDWELMQ